MALIINLQSKTKKESEYNWDLKEKVNFQTQHIPSFEGRVSEATRESVANTPRNKNEVQKFIFSLSATNFTSI